MLDLNGAVYQIETSRGPKFIELTSAGRILLQWLKDEGCLKDSIAFEEIAIEDLT